MSHKAMHPRPSLESALQELDLARPGVCIIEDDIDLRDALARGLRLEGYRVLEARDGREVIGQEARVVGDFGPFGTIDLFVTDFWLPETTGLDVLSYLRERDWASKAVLISAYANDQVYWEARRLGAAAILDKPFSLDAFLETVHRLAPLN